MKISCASTTVVFSLSLKAALERIWKRLKDTQYCLQSELPLFHERRHSLPSVQFLQNRRLNGFLLAKIGGFAAIFARSGSHQTKPVALDMLTLKVQSHLILKPENLHYVSPLLRLWTMLFSTWLQY